MNKFESIIQEAGVLTKAWNKTGDTLNSLKNIGSIAAQTVKSGSLAPFIDIFKKYKSKVKFVNHDTALSSSKTFFNSTVVTNVGDDTGQKKYAPNAVVMDDDSGFSGVVGKAVNYEKDPIINKFKQFLIDKKINFDINSFINNTKKNNRFWIIISPKGEITVDMARQEEEQAEQELFSTPVQESCQFTNIINSYHPNIILEQNKVKKIKNLVPSNVVSYDSWFIYESEFPANVGKFVITLQGQPPKNGIGKSIKLEKDLIGLIQAGNKTLYSKWYFLNDFDDLEEQDKNKEEPKASSLLSRDRVSATTPQATTPQATTPQATTPQAT
jgi:hypothetical protein